MDILKNEEEIRRIYRRLEPSLATVEFIKEQSNANKKMDLALNDMTNQIQRFSDEMKEWKSENAKQHEDIMTALKEMKTDSVSQIEFTPIRKLVYGAAGFILFAVLSAIVYLVIKDKV